MILLHDHGTQEWCDEGHREYTGNGVGIPMELPTGQHFAGYGQHKGKHHGNGCRRKDGVNNGVDGHLREQAFPLALLLTMRIAHGQLVKRLDKLTRQTLLKVIIGWRGQTNHIRGQEGSDD